MVRDMVKLLRILAMHDARLWEAIAPHVPKEWLIASTQDPIPPAAHLRVERVLQIEVRETVRLVAEAALGAVAAGQMDAAQRMVADVDGDWCGTGWPGRWPKPGPKAEVYLLESPAVAWQVVQAAGALAFGAYAAALDDEKVAAMFGEAADRLAKAALAGEAR